MVINDYMKKQNILLDLKFNQTRFSLFTWVFKFVYNCNKLI